MIDEERKILKITLDEAFEVLGQAYDLFSKEEIYCKLNSLLMSYRYFDIDEPAKLEKDRHRYYTYL